MSAGQKANGSQSPLDAILRSLTDRPNVESTLILARKDGSIIKSTGLDNVEGRRRSQPNVAYPREALDDDKTKNSSSEGTDAPSDVSPTPSQAQQLASSIFEFVKTASSLGLVLGSVSTENEEDGTVFRRLQQSEKPSDRPSPEESEQVREEGQVQLLRLRIKSREIIVFPDPQYLCCVVQKIAKHGAAGDTQ